MTATDLRKAPRTLKLVLLGLLILLSWHLTAPTAYQDNIDDIVDTADPHGYVPFFVFLVATALFVHNWPRAELYGGIVLAAICSARQLAFELTTRKGAAAEDLTHLAGQPGMLYLLGISAGAVMAWSGARKLSGGHKRERRHILFLGATRAYRRGRRSRRVPATPAPAPDWTTPFETDSERPSPVELERELKSELPERRLDAVAALGALGGEARASVPALVHALRDPDPVVREATIAALERIVGTGAEWHRKDRGAAASGELPSASGQ